MFNRAIPSDKHPFKGKQPCHSALDFPPPAVTPKRSAVLSFRFYPIATMRSNQLNAFFFEPFIQRISVIGTIPDNSSRSSQGEGFIEGSFDKGDFMR